MKNITFAFNKITKASRVFALLILSLMMFFITFSVLSRVFGKPFIGSVEIVELMMVTIIMLSLEYCESQNAHISVEILYDKFPKKVQHALTIFTKILSIIVTFIVGYVFYQVAIDGLLNGSKTTDLLTIPFYPFEFVIAIGATLWFLQLLLKREGNGREDDYAE